MICIAPELKGFHFVIKSDEVTGIFTLHRVLPRDSNAIVRSIEKYFVFFDVPNFIISSRLLQVDFPVPASRHHLIIRAPA
ncbi:MAG: hypothetical protein CR217_09300 [Beijerinckiaceae bacterium]|nr:MAG: hypothetical protein CR217_09300 [Beijerinckiaceae bacterium]